MKLSYIVREDSIIKEYLLSLGLSRKFCRKVKLYGKMFVNGREALNYYPIKNGDILEIEYDEKENENIEIDNEPLDIKYEDEHLMVINKPISLACQPSKAHFNNNVVSRVKGYYKEKGIISNIHIVNRLDYQTSGLMCITKDGFTHHALTKEKIITRKYLLVVQGHLENKKDTISLPIKRCNEISIKREVNENGQVAITEYEVIKENDKYSLVEAKLVTGRTHQIRVHFSYLGHPLIGDKLYGKEDERLLLHCYYLEFINPNNNEKIKLLDYPDFYKKFN